jgi:hypothetical protein
MKSNPTQPFLPVEQEKGQRTNEKIHELMKTFSHQKRTPMQIKPNPTTNPNPTFLPAALSSFLLDEGAGASPSTALLGVLEEGVFDDLGAGDESGDLAPKSSEGNKTLSN